MELRTLRYFVAVAEELHFGRAAARLNMTQPPLSRAIRQLESDLGCELLLRSPAGVTLTPAGGRLYDEARVLLARADQARDRVAAAAPTLTLGTLADSAQQAGARLSAVFRERHPTVRVRVREADLTDPTTGLRAGLVDVALTRAPFDDTGIALRVLRSDPVGVILRVDDPLAGRGRLAVAELADRQWFRFPDGTDPVWRAFWTDPCGARTAAAGLAGTATGVTGRPDDRDGPVVRTAHECLQSVLWDGTVGLAPLPVHLPAGLTAVPLTGVPSSDLVIAWDSERNTPLVRSFVRIATALLGRSRVTAVGGLHA
ncbi:LysR family transcriptional regulator [Streptomyces sp. NPDC001480]|uniref:LysR family transcriptional regulator n=1 Tax=Streptomyces sp. NPDC001480 TaxID=3364577 RepID=UPI0036C07C9D